MAEMKTEGSPGTPLALAGHGGTHTSTAPVSLVSFCLYFLRLGTLGFGGPTALVGEMQHDLLDAAAGSTARITSKGYWPWKPPGCAGRFIAKMAIAGFVRPASGKFAKLQ